MTHKGSDTKTPKRNVEALRGEKTHARIIEQLESGATGSAAQPSHEHTPDGTHRLFERRDQHDEAEQKSEKNHLDHDVDEHHHNRENFQVPGEGAS